MNKQIILSAICGFMIPALLAGPLGIPARAEDPSSYIDAQLEKEHYLRGDVNNDGRIDYADRSALIYTIRGTAPSYYNPADVDGNGLVNYDDYYYLNYYLWRAGPPPCVEQVQYCTSSPCYVRLDDQVIQLTARKTAEGTDYAAFLAEAFNTKRYNKEKIAYLSMNVFYRDIVTAVNLTFERVNSPHGLPDIPRTNIEDIVVYPTCNDEGARGKVDVLTALMGLSALTTAKVTSRSELAPDLIVPQSPAGCSGPVNIPTFPISKLQDSCCINHDFCYQRGGSSAEKLKCDNNFYDCLTKAIEPNWNLWNKEWLYKNTFVIKLMTMFKSPAFRVHNEDWTCFLHPQDGIDEYLDAGTLINDCSPCEGLDACDINCVVEFGGTTAEYPCVKNKYDYSTETEGETPTRDIKAPTVQLNFEL